MVDVPSIEEVYEMTERQRYLNMHKYKKYQGADGKYYTTLPDETKRDKRRKLKRNTLEELDDAIVNFWKEQEENPTLKEIFNEWNDRRLSLNKISKASYSRHTQIFDQFYQNDFGNRKIKNITPTDISDFLEEQISKHNLTAKAFQGLKGITKGFLLRAKKRGFISFNVNEIFTELDVSDSEFRIPHHNDCEQIFFKDEAETLEEYMREHLDITNIGLLLIFATGLRIGELVALKHEDFGDMMVHVTKTETRYKNPDGQGYIYEVSDHPKTKAGNRDVIITEKHRWLIDLIKQTNLDYEYVFTKDGKRMHTGQFRNRIYRLCEKLGIQPKSPHKIRKTYGTILIESGINDKTIESQMGHTNISCTRTYYYKDMHREDEKRKTLNAVEGL